MTQWHVWDPDITDGDRGDQQTKEVLVRAFLKDRQFVAGRTVQTPILIFSIRYEIGGEDAILASGIRRKIEYCDFIGRWG